MPQAESLIRCPKCGSTQIAANKKGFGLGKAAIGGLLIGPVGLLGGLIGSGKVIITCLKCGHPFPAGSGHSGHQSGRLPPSPEDQKAIEEAKQQARTLIPVLLRRNPQATVHEATALLVQHGVDVSRLPHGDVDFVLMLNRPC